MTSSSIKRALISILLLVGVANLLLAQQRTHSTAADLSPAERVQALRNFVQKYEQQLSQTLDQKEGLLEGPQMNAPFLDTIFFAEDTLILGSAEYALLKAEQDQLLKDWGLDISIGFLNNFEQTLLDSEGRFYRRRYQTGVNFELLSNGLFENRLKARLKSYEMQLLTLDSQQEEKRIASRKVYFRLLNLFNRLRIDAIEEYLNALQIEIELLRDLSSIGYDVREILRDLIRLELDYRMELQDFKAMSLQIPDYPVEDQRASYLPPLLDIQVESLFQSVEDDTLWQKKEAIVAEMNQLRYKWWRSISLGFDTRYNYFDRLNEATNPFLRDREFFSMSATLRIPFESLRGGNKRMAELATAAEVEDWYEAKLNQGNSLFGNFEEYQNRKRRVQEIISEMDINRQRLEDERRKSQLNQVNYNPAQILRLKNQQFMLEVEYIEALEYAYMTLFRMWIQRPELPISSFTSVPTIRTFANRGKRSAAIYLWSDALLNTPNEEILEQIVQNNFNRVLLSVGKAEANGLRKTQALVDELRRIDIPASLIVSNNALLFDTDSLNNKVQAYVQKAVALNMNEIHVDIEPHTLNSWKDNRGMLEGLYINMLKAFNKEAELVDIKLSVAIPHFYDELLPEIARLVDFAFVMVYETNDISKINNRLALERNHFNTEKLFIVLRTDDFPNDRELYEAMNALENIGGRTHFGIHDFSSFRERLRLDTSGERKE